MKIKEFIIKFVSEKNNLLIKVKECLVILKNLNVKRGIYFKFDKKKIVK